MRESHAGYIYLGVGISCEADVLFAFDLDISAIDIHASRLHLVLYLSESLYRRVAVLFAKLLALRREECGDQRAVVGYFIQFAARAESVRGIDYVVYWSLHIIGTFGVVYLLTSGR